MNDQSLGDPMVAPSPGPRPRPHRDPARTTLAAGLSVLVTLIGLIFLAWLVLFITKGRFLKPYFEKYASNTAGRPVRVTGDFWLFFNPINIRFRAEGLTVDNPAWAKRPKFVTSKLIDTSIATFPAIFGHYRFNWVNLDAFVADLEWDAKDKRNTWTFEGPTHAFKIPEIRQATVAGTEVHYTDPLMKVAADIKFDTIRGADTRFANAISFHGDGTARAHPFTLRGSLKSPNQLIAGGRNQFEMHAASEDTYVDVSGTLPGATVIEGADLAVGVRGRNLQNLFDLAGIAVPPTRAYKLTSHFTKDGGIYKFTRIVGHYGASDLSGRLFVSLPGKGNEESRMKLDAELASRAVDIIDIGPFIGYDPAKLDAKGAKATVTQVNGTPRILPDAPLRVDAISAFDAHVVYKVKDIKQPYVPISNVNLTLDLDHSKLALSPLNFDMSRGHVDSDITINARQHPVYTDYDIRLSPTPLNTLFKGFGLDQSGTSGVIKARIKMNGRGDTVHESLASSNGRMAVILSQGDFWTRNIQLSEFDIGTYLTKLLGKKLKKPVRVNCGLVAFTVRDGVAASDPILIDTDKNVITGNGGFSFKDESLDIGIRARAKTFSLFSGQSPVGVNGHFAAPGVKIISPQLLARGGGAVALGVVATPLAAILPFIDLGHTPAAQCGPVLAGATAAAQQTVKGKPVKGVDTRAKNLEKARK